MEVEIPPLAAAVATVALRETFGLVEYPFLRVRILLQTQNELIRQDRLARPYKGPLDCVTRIIANDGLSGLWHGARAFVTSQIVSRFATALVGGISLRLMSHTEAAETSHLQGHVEELMGTMASMLVVHPLHFICTKLMTDMQDPAKDTRQAYPNGASDVVRTTFQRAGLMTFFTGLLPAMAGELCSRFCFYALHKTLRPIILGDGAQFHTTFLFTSVIYIVAKGISAPFFVVELRSMVAAGTHRAYNSAIDCAGRVVRQEGYAPLFHGVMYHMFGIALSLTMAEQLLQSTISQVAPMT